MTDARPLSEVLADYPELKGDAGLSAYEVALTNGFVGTEAEWLLSLEGPQGATGNTGLKGDKGDKGDTGNTGATGAPGTTSWAGITDKPAFFAPGHGAGDGGAVTQATSKSTAVTLNKASGRITLSNAALAANTSASFTLNNSAIGANDNVLVTIVSGATINTYLVGVDTIAAGSCRIHLRNISATSRSEALVIGFSVIKGSIT